MVIEREGGGTIVVIAPPTAGLAAVVTMTLGVTLTQAQGAV